jgi:hypothetical protein
VKDETRKKFLSLEASPTTLLGTPVISSHLLPIKVTPVFDSYWRFAAERQSVFRQRLERQPAPWTADPVIAIHKFTNAYRASDRASQFLIRNVIYRDDLPNSPSEVLFRTLLFKLFNKIETWNLLEHSFGEITFKNYKFEHYDNVLRQAMRAGGRIYSAAYIMPPGGSTFGYPAKHQNHLRLLERMMADDLAGQLSRLTKMQNAFELLKSYPTVGNFLAYQFVTDINYSEVTDFSEMDFVIPGPGARDGLRKCFSDSAGLNESQLIRLMAENQEQEFERLGIKFQTLWGRRLQLIDCQNLFCEVDKYARVAHPNVTGISGRTRIKQKFSPTGTLDRPWYPPKWGINSKIELDLLGGDTSLEHDKINRTFSLSTSDLGSS